MPCVVREKESFRWSKLSHLSDHPQIAIIGSLNDSRAAPSDCADVDLPSSYHVISWIVFTGCKRCSSGYVLSKAAFILSEETVPTHSISLHVLRIT